MCRLLWRHRYSQLCHKCQHQDDTTFSDTLLNFIICAVCASFSWFVHERVFQIPTIRRTYPAHILRVSIHLLTIHVFRHRWQGDDISTGAISMQNYQFVGNTQMDIHVSIYIHETWMSIRVFLSEWVLRHRYDMNIAWIFQRGCSHLHQSQSHFVYKT